MYRYIPIILTALCLAFPTYADDDNGGEARANANARAAAKALTGPVSASSDGGTYIGLGGGAAGAISNRWECAVSESTTVGPIGWTRTHDNPVCLADFKRRLACINKDRDPDMAKACNQLTRDIVAGKYDEDRAVTVVAVSTDEPE